MFVCQVYIFKDESKWLFVMSKCFTTSLIDYLWIKSVCLKTNLIDYLGSLYVLQLV